MRAHLPRAVVRAIAASDAKLIGIDAIKLIESGLGALCEETVAVTAPEEVRVRRIMARDGITREAALARVHAQKDEAYFRARCGAEFVNDFPSLAEAETAARDFVRWLL